MLEWNDLPERKTKFWMFSNGDIYFTDTLINTIEMVDGLYPQEPEGPIFITGQRFQANLSDFSGFTDYFYKLNDVRDLVENNIKKYKLNYKKQGNFLEKLFGRSKPKNEIKAYSGNPIVLGTLSSSDSADYFIYRNPELIEWQEYVEGVMFGAVRVDNYLMARAYWQGNCVEIDATESIIAVHDALDRNAQKEGIKDFNRDKSLDVMVMNDEVLGTVDF